uniref:DRBM domain-containing protein n=1 Tax=Ascaris lumbricoides TaxID=6252 RepID=A0A0M3IHW2_ASCLU
MDALLAYDNANGYVAGEQGRSTRENRAKAYTRSVAMSLLQLIPDGEFNNPSASDSSRVSSLQQEISSPSPRQNLRKRLSMAQYDNMLLYQYFNQLLEELMTSISKIEKAVHGIREEIVSLLPQDDLYSKWQTVIRRLEIISLVFYISLVCITVFLFFYHDWYCAIGHNPCGQLNLKCPWMQVEPTHPHCL